MHSQPRPVVALVGLGNIGFRHLQGLNALSDRVRLIGVDLDEQNLARARAEWKGADALFSTGATPADARADALILATSSKGRLGLMRHWGERLRPSGIILEKITFTRESEFDEAGALAERLGASVFVNCPRRIWPAFAAVKNRLAAASGPIEVSLSDPDLGLACNGVHIVDAFQHLTGEDEVTAQSAEFDAIFEAKRPGYKEAHGRIVVASASGHRLDLTVRPDDAADRRLHVRRGALSLALDQARGAISFGGGETLDCGRAPYQSELTGAVVSDLLDCGTCGLPSLSASARAHAAMLGPLRAALEAAGVDCRDGLPIT